MSSLSCHLLKETKEEVLTDLFVAWGRQASSWRDLFWNLQFSLSPLPPFSGGESESFVRADDSEVPFKDMWNKFCETRQDSQLVYCTPQSELTSCFQVLWRQIQGDHRRMESSWGGALDTACVSKSYIWMFLDQWPRIFSKNQWSMAFAENLSILAANLHSSKKGTIDKYENMIQSNSVSGIATRIFDPIFLCQERRQAEELEQQRAQVGDDMMTSTQVAVDLLICFNLTSSLEVLMNGFCGMLKHRSSKGKSLF